MRPMDDSVRMSPDTLLVSGGRPPRAPGAPVSPGVELTSTFVLPGDFVPGVPVYGRDSNATWQAFESVVGALEGAPEGATAFASGMAAGQAIFSLMPRGTRLVMGSTTYNAMLQSARDKADAGHLDLVLVDVSDTDAVRGVLPGADWLLLESPTNPLLQVADVPALCAAARDAGVRVAVDNTFATPLLQNPLLDGADVVMHSATKYLSGHSDVLLGVVIARDPDLVTAVRRHRTFGGGVPGPMEAWLALRGLRTLGVRFERQQANAASIAARLASHPGVARVRYPGLPDDPGYAVAKATMRGFGAMIAFEPVGGVDAATAITHAVQLWVPATSLGGVESLIERRRRIPTEPDTVPDALLRLSVGIEDADDLWADLSAALDAATR